MDRPRRARGNVKHDEDHRVFDHWAKCLPVVGAGLVVKNYITPTESCTALKSPSEICSGRSICMS